MLQRLHAATFRGVAMLINSRPVMRTGPEVPQEASPLPVPPPPPRPVINFTTNCSPHHAGCVASTFYQHTWTIYRDGARHPRHLNARVSALLLLK